MDILLLENIQQTSFIVALVAWLFIVATKDRPPPVSAMFMALSVLFVSISAACTITLYRIWLV